MPCLGNLSPFRCVQNQLQTFGQLLRKAVRPCGINKTHTRQIQQTNAAQQIAFAEIPTPALVPSAGLPA